VRVGHGQQRWGLFKATKPSSGQDTEYEAKQQIHLALSILL